MIKSRKLPHNPKSQSALEFLTGYGWMILALLAAIAALAYFGVVSPGRFLSDKCFLEAGITCLDFSMGTKSVTLALKNNVGEAITIDKVTVARKDSSCSNTEPKAVQNNEKLVLTLTGCDNGIIGDKFDGEINITYTKESGLVHTTNGRMIATISAGDDDNGDGNSGDDGGENITCSSDLDCGTSGFAGSYYCADNNITINQIDYACLNPGTVNSSCVASNTSVFVDYCDPALNEVCVDGNDTCSVNGTATPTIEIIQITTDPAGQFMPVIYDDIIVWQDWRYGGSDIYMYDLSTGKETRVTNVTRYRGPPAIYGNIIAWEQGSYKNPDIYMYDISTGQESLVSSGKFWPSIYGDKIVYTDHKDIFVYDVSTGQETKLSIDGTQLNTLAIYDDKVAWADFSGEKDIIMYDLSTGQETRVTTNPREQHSPEIYENKIVFGENWISGSGLFWADIYMYDISTGQETPIATTSSNEENPSIYGNIIAWQGSLTAEPWYVDIYIYDLSTGQKTQVTTSGPIHEYPDIYENKIVWHQGIGSETNYDIYMAIIS